MLLGFSGDERGRADLSYQGVKNGWIIPRLCYYSLHPHPRPELPVDLPPDSWPWRTPRVRPEQGLTCRRACGLTEKPQAAHTFRRLGACRAQRHVHSLLKRNSSGVPTQAESAALQAVGQRTPSQMRGGVNPERTFFLEGVGMEGKKNQVCFFLPWVDTFISLFLLLKNNSLSLNIEQLEICR